MPYDHFYSLLSNIVTVSLPKAAQQNLGGGKREEEEEEEDLSLVYAARGQQMILHCWSALLLLLLFLSTWGFQKFGFLEFKLDFKTKKLWIFLIGLFYQMKCV